MTRKEARKVLCVRTVLGCALSFAFMGCTPPPPVTPPPTVTPASPPLVTAMTLDALHQGDTAHGWSAVSAYIDDEGRSRGARFVHTRTGFTLDLLSIESSPQAMLYVGTYPSTSDGEPHTQEHLLLGRGNKGRMLGNLDHVSLTEWSAFTAQFRTAYHFRTNAGPRAFFPVFETQLDALLHPDYTDEDIRREVRDFEVTRGASGKRALTEKGTVYNEMVRTFDNPEERGGLELGRLIYGQEHPLALSSGGTPAGIRKVAPSDIRKFHGEHYRLGNMGVVLALPSATALDDPLGQLDAIFARVEPQTTTPIHVMTEHDLPAPSGAAPGALTVVPYPYEGPDHPSPAMFGWPPIVAPNLVERALLDAFLEALAGGAGSVLYGALVDDKTRRLDTGATGVQVSASDELADPAVSVQVDGIRGTSASLQTLTAVRDVVVAEMARLAALPDGSKELIEFQDKVSARLVRKRRSLDKALDTPPEFGTRGTYDAWIIRLALLAHEPGFQKSITFKGALEGALAVARSRDNPWRARIASWGLARAPYGVITQPSPTLRSQEDRERAARETAEIARLVGMYRARSADVALEKREAEVEEATAEIARAEAAVTMPPLTQDPPMTDDDLLAYRVTSESGVPVVASTFNTMKSATVGLVLSLADVPDELLPYVAVLPRLLRRVGVVKDGIAVPYDVVDDRVRREVLGVNVGLSVSFDTKRAELELTASGNDPAETQKALGFLSDFLFHADLRPGNLPRIRDVVRERATELADVMSGAEEHWVKTAARSYQRQDSPVLLHAGSFLTQAYDARVALWRLGGDRHATDLTQLSSGLPKESARRDLKAITAELAHASASPPERALDAMGRLVATVRHRDRARVWVVGSAAHQEAIRPTLDSLLASLDSSPTPMVTRESRPLVVSRAKERGADVRDATLVALVNGSLSRASLSNTAPIADLHETRESALIDFLAADVFSGAGAHSFYKRIWGAGLAYSGYANAHARSARLELYTDRCADLGELVRFAEHDVRAAPSWPGLIDYAIASELWSRGGETYEARARAIAADLVDGFGPDVVRAFRTRLLSLRGRPDVAEAVHARVLPVYADIIPTLPSEGPVPGGVMFATGPEALLSSYEKTIRAARGEGVTLLRLYPRDFWDVR
jgi:hypothetical protein